MVALGSVFGVALGPLVRPVLFVFSEDSGGFVSLVERGAFVVLAGLSFPVASVVLKASFEVLEAVCTSVSAGRGVRVALAARVVLAVRVVLVVRAVRAVRAVREVAVFFAVLADGDVFVVSAASAASVISAVSAAFVALSASAAASVAFAAFVFVARVDLVVLGVTVAFGPLALRVVFVLLAGVLERESVDSEEAGALSLFPVEGDCLGVVRRLVCREARPALLPTFIFCSVPFLSSSDRKLFSTRNASRSKSEDDVSPMSIVSSFILLLSPAYPQMYFGKRHRSHFTPRKQGLSNTYYLSINFSRFAAGKRVLEAMPRRWRVSGKRYACDKPAPPLLSQFITPMRGGYGGGG
jgi:hypothetical protein